MHMSKRHGYTYKYIEEEGFKIQHKLIWIADKEPSSPGKESALALSTLFNVFSTSRPDALMLVGDRYETLSAAQAATLARLPIIHIHGGEETLGAIDNLFRNAISKMAHLHFTSHEKHSLRLIRMGENPEIIHNVGAPGLDNIHVVGEINRATLERHLGIELVDPIIIITLHPVTSCGDPTKEALAIQEAIKDIDATFIVTLPNTDPENGVVRDIMLKMSKSPKRLAVEALGEKRYWALMKIASCMCGNSSSGIIEAPILKLPVVNIGDRQKGRERGENVIDVDPNATDIKDAIELALSVGFKKALVNRRSPYGEGNSSKRIINILNKWVVPADISKASIYNLQ